jgi:RecJ-like exonuclease
MSVCKDCGDNGWGEAALRKDPGPESVIWQLNQKPELEAVGISNWVCHHCRGDCNAVSQSCLRCGGLIWECRHCGAIEGQRHPETCPLMRAQPPIEGYLAIA